MVVNIRNHGETYMINVDFYSLGNKRYINDQTFNPHTFDRLAEQYPSLDNFVNFDGGNRRNNQRDHVKKFISIGSKIKTNLFETSAVNAEWNGFIQYLESNEYHAFISNQLEITDFEIGFEWAVIEDGNDLCPHSDCCKKLGTHLFFFPHLCWNGIGGDFVFLDGSNNSNNPEMVDFIDSTVIKYQDNRSILFANSKEYRNWHSVTKVKSNIVRRVFQVIFWAKHDVKCYQI
jgi:hypothetical protein